jgi:hypothetical protein
MRKHRLLHAPFPRILFLDARSMGMQMRKILPPLVPSASVSTGAPTLFATGPDQGSLTAKTGFLSGLFFAAYM